MLAILFMIDVIWVPFAIIVAALAGFSFRGAQIRKYKKQVSSLEREMLNSHAEILSLQAEMVKLETRVPNSKTLIVSMKEMGSSSEEGADRAKSAGGKK